VVGLTVDTFGVGLTVTTTFIGIPGHPLAVGVTIYITVPDVASELVSVCEIVDPFDADAPVIVPVIVPTVQLNVAPETLLLNGMFVVAPLQIVVMPPAVALGAGFTVTTMFTGVPGHELAVGVTA
jgi:hypothetical protein